MEYFKGVMFDDEVFKMFEFLKEKSVVFNDRNDYGVMEELDWKERMDMLGGDNF